MKHFSKIIVLCAFLLLVSGQSYGQRCGKGIFSFRFYVLNGEKVDSLRYEIIPIVSDAAGEVIFGNNTEFAPEDAQLYREIQNGFILDSAFAMKVVNANQVSDDSVNIRFEEFLNHRDVKTARSGVVLGGTLTFPTFETSFMPCLLKISTSERAMYILVNLFGGCNRERKIIWAKWRPYMVQEIYD